LIWTHKIEYLRATTKMLKRHRRAFCIPEHEVKNSPRYERIVLLLAVALMEAFQITVDVTTDPDHGQVEGFVLGGEAIVANWLRAPGLWYVESNAPPSRRMVYRDIAEAASSRSIIEQPTAACRLEALAGYLNIPWRWSRKRCTELSASAPAVSPNHAAGCSPPSALTSPSTTSPASIETKENDCTPLN
jgi:hypothetical protein